MEKKQFWSLAKFGIFQITSNIYQGAFPEKNTLEKLYSLGVRTIVNCAPARYEAQEIEIYNFPFEDLKAIPEDIIEKSIETISSAIKQQKKVFVHCVAGQNRSANIVWLYLLACGYEESEAENLIDKQTLDANPKHPLLINTKLVLRSKIFGQKLTLDKTNV